MKCKTIDMLSESHSIIDYSFLFFLIPVSCLYQRCYMYMYLRLHPLIDILNIILLSWITCRLEYAILDHSFNMIFD